METGSADLVQSAKYNMKLTNKLTVILPMQKSDITREELAELLARLKEQAKEQHLRARVWSVVDGKWRLSSISEAERKLAAQARSRQRWRKQYGSKKK